MAQRAAGSNPVTHPVIFTRSGTGFENKITQQELAEKLQVAFSTVNRWERSQESPELSHSKANRVRDKVCQKQQVVSRRPSESP